MNSLLSFPSNLPFLPLPYLSLNTAPLLTSNLTHHPFHLLPSLSLNPPNDLRHLSANSSLEILALINSKQQLLERLRQYEQFTVQSQAQKNMILKQICFQKPSNSPSFHSLDTKDELSYYSSPENTLSEISKQYEGSELHAEFSTSNLQSQIVDMVKFFLDKFGTISNKEMISKRKQYTHSPILVNAFDVLNTKFASAKKCREDMTRFVLRKTISYLRDCERFQKGYDCKTASLALCKKYFPGYFDNDNQLDFKSEEDLISHLLPYKKHSRNRTANTSFITEIFSSEDFYRDYCSFLEKFDNILELENEKKMEKLIQCVLRCIQKSDFAEVKNFKRLPWLRSWLGATMTIAQELKDFNSWNEKRNSNASVKTKKIKIDEVSQ